MDPKQFSSTGSAPTSAASERRVNSGSASPRPTDAEIRARFGAAIETALAEKRSTTGRDAGRDAGADPAARPVHAQCVSRHSARVRGRCGRIGPRRGTRRLRALDRRFERAAALVHLHTVRALRAARRPVRIGAVVRRAGGRRQQGPLEWARKHFEVIRRFGRFPHRNDILGRASTPEEVEFLSRPGSRF